MSQKPTTEQIWRMVLEDEQSPLRKYRRLFALMPSNPRCTYCNAPFVGVGGFLARTIWDRKRGNLNPRMCSACENFAKANPGGAEIELTLLFADVRGSTRIAETMNPSEFSRLMDRFYAAATDVAAETEGLIEKFVGDEACIMYVPGIAGKQHAARAVEGAKRLLELTGHNDPKGPWIPVGVGVHTGIAFVGGVGSAGVVQFTALGNTANTAARLASTAPASEILISEATCSACGQQLEHLERQDLELKGRSESLPVRVIRYPVQ